MKGHTKTMSAHAFLNITRKIMKQKPSILNQVPNNVFKPAVSHLVTGLFHMQAYHSD